MSQIVDVIVVSDHGMCSTANERVVYGLNLVSVFAFAESAICRYLDEVLGEAGFAAIEHKEGKTTL